MRSIRAKTTILNVAAVVVSMIAATAIGAITIANFGHERAEKELALMCEDGKHRLNNYFKSVEQSVEIVSDLVDSSLDNIPDATFNDDFADHIAYVDNIFSSAAKKTNGVLTYYYRVDHRLNQ